MAAAKKSADGKSKPARKKGPKFAARLVAPSGSVIKISTLSKPIRNGFELQVNLYPSGDASPTGARGARAAHDLIVSKFYETFDAAQTAGEEQVEIAKSKGFAPKAKGGKQEPAGWDVVEDETAA